MTDNMTQSDTQDHALLDIIIAARRAVKSRLSDTMEADAVNVLEVEVQDAITDAYFASTGRVRPVPEWVPDGNLPEAP